MEIRYVDRCFGVFDYTNLTTGLYSKSICISVIYSYIRDNHILYFFANYVVQQFATPTIEIKREWLHLMDEMMIDQQIATRCKRSQQGDLGFYVPPTMLIMHSFNL